MDFLIAPRLQGAALARPRPAFTASLPSAIDSNQAAGTRIKERVESSSTLGGSAMQVGGPYVIRRQDAALIHGQPLPRRFLRCLIR